MQQPYYDFLQPLIGHWVDDGNQTSSGYFSFAPDLQATVYVRRNHSVTGATAENPPYQHDDLMVVYYNKQENAVRAWYTDNEGHVIHYHVRLLPDNITIEFQSDEQSNTPQFRLRYTPENDDTLHIEFAIAPPDQPGIFVPYIQGKVRRSSAAMRQ